jgi:hypothetical protein
MKPIENNISLLEVVIVTDLGAEEFTPPSNSLLIGPYAPVFMQVLPPRSEFVDSSPIQWATMKGTPEVSSSGAIVTPSSTIVTIGIFPSNTLNQKTSVVQSTVVTSINNSGPLVVGSTQPFGVAI